MSLKNTSSGASIEVLFTPADFEAFGRRNPEGMTCVVFDVLRATSSMITALANGAAAIVPVAEISEALEFRRRDPEVLLAGERDGLRITAELTGSIPFDLGNSPREFVPAVVKGRTIVMTTTNGTRALRAALNADAVYVASFLNLSETTGRITARLPKQLVLICSGTFEQTGYEDVLAAGAMCHALWNFLDPERVSDAALIARKAYLDAANNLVGALEQARNGRRLLARPELAADVAFCARRDATPIGAVLSRTGTVVKC